ncbi:helix-turn-helix domain-containing protein [Terrabacter terrigena]|uniref:Helix-turn-helix domain-containing protein n=1 Tax=Terrabacter terrigena TaxID=574718 RepID=A0ABW3N140_9MICO
MIWRPHRRLLTIEEAARSAGCKPGTIRRWIRTGRLRVVAHKRRQPLLLESDVLEADARIHRRRARPRST